MSVRSDSFVSYRRPLRPGLDWISSTAPEQGSGLTVHPGQHQPRAPGPAIRSGSWRRGGGSGVGWGGVGAGVGGVEPQSK